MAAPARGKPSSAGGLRSGRLAPWLICFNRLASTLVVLPQRGKAVLGFLFFFFFCQYLLNKAPFFPADWLT